MPVIDRFKLSNKVALVTGAGRNLGREIALSLAEAGADVALTARSTPEIEKTAVNIRKQGQKALALTMDVTDF